MELTVSYYNSSLMKYNPTLQTGEELLGGQFSVVPKMHSAIHWISHFPVQVQNKENPIICVIQWIEIYPVGRAIPSEKLVLELHGIPVVLNSAYNLSILLVEIKFSIRMSTNKILMNLLQPWNRQSQAKWCR